MCGLTENTMSGKWRVMWENMKMWLLAEKKEAYSLNDERLQMVEMQRDPSVLVHNP